MLQAGLPEPRTSQLFIEPESGILAPSSAVDDMAIQVQRSASEQSIGSWSSNIPGDLMALATSAQSDFRSKQPSTLRNVVEFIASSRGVWFSSMVIPSPLAILLAFRRNPSLMQVPSSMVPSSATADITLSSSSTNTMDLDFLSRGLVVW